MAFPEDIKTRLQEFLEQHNLSFSLKPKLCGELGHHRSRPSPDLPLYEVTQEVLWVDRAEELQRIQQTLESHVAVQAASAQSGRALQVGVDSEWGSQPEAGPSVVQLAISGTIWVIDALAISSQLSSLLLWLNSQPKIQLLGFHFSSDAERLQRLAAADWTQVRDLQREARCHARVLFQNGHMPGLRRLCEVYLGKLLDKSLQCSNWDQRPLSAEQIRYAGSDAAVLLDIAEAMDAEQEETKERALQPVQLLCVERRERLEDARDELYSAGYYLADHDEARPQLRSAAQERKAQREAVEVAQAEQEEEEMVQKTVLQTTLFDPVLMTPEERVLPVAYEVGKPSAELLLVWLPGNTEAAETWSAAARAVEGESASGLRIMVTERPAGGWHSWSDKATVARGMEWYEMHDMPTDEAIAQAAKDGRWIRPPVSIGRLTSVAPRGFDCFSVHVTP
eukprot:g32601.t1